MSKIASLEELARQIEADRRSEVSPSIRREVDRGIADAEEWADEHSPDSRRSARYRKVVQREMGRGAVTGQDKDGAYQVAIGETQLDHAGRGIKRLYGEKILTNLKSSKARSVDKSEYEAVQLSPEEAHRVRLSMINREIHRRKMTGLGVARSFVSLLRAGKADKITDNMIDTIESMMKKVKE